MERFGESGGTDTASPGLLLTFFPLEHNGSKQRGNDTDEPQHPPFNIYTKRKAQWTLAKKFLPTASDPSTYIVKDTYVFHVKEISH
jgi:hypothetical protein